MSDATVPSPRPTPRRWPSPRTALGLLVPAFLIFVVSWPDFRPGEMVDGLDPSWHAGLAMARLDGLQFGREIIFTYGPLGFLKGLSLYYTETYRLALAYQLAMHFAFAVVLFWCARRTFGAFGGFLLALLAACFLMEDPMIPLATLGAIAVLGDRGIDPGRWFAPLAGAVVGFEALGKVSVGIIVFAVFLVAILCRDGRRREPLLIYLGTAAVAFVLSWLAAGQSLGAIWDYGINSIPIVTGYSGAMSTETPGTLWQYWAALLVALIILWGGLCSTRTVTLHRRVGVLLILALVLYTGFKEGFVRHDPGHAWAYFSTMLVIAVGLPWERFHRRPAVVSIAALAIAVFGVTTIDPIDLVHPITRPQQLWAQVRLSAQGEKRNAEIDATQIRLQNEVYKFSPELIAAIGPHTVTALPWEAQAVYAYRFNWRPLPIFQSYSAYTPKLDQLNADALRAADAPERILRTPTNFDIEGRSTSFDTPRQTLAMLCHYVSLRAEAPWQVLGRTATPRCGTGDRPLATFHVRWGERITLPTVPPGHLLLADVDGLQVGGLETIQSLAWRPEPRYVYLDDARVRLTTETAGDGLLLQVPPRNDYPQPFTLAPNPATITFARGEDVRQSGGEITVKLRVMPISGPGTVQP